MKPLQATHVAVDPREKLIYVEKNTNKRERKDNLGNYQKEEVHLASLPNRIWFNLLNKIY